MEVARIVLDFVRAVLSPQVIAGAVAAALLLLFKQDLRKLLARMVMLKIGRAQVSLSQAEISRREPDLPTPPPAAAPEVPEHPSREQVLNTLAVYQRMARMWEFRYLNHFLVPDTQWVLDWCATTSEASVQTLGLVYEPADAALDALFKHRLIEQEGDAIHATDKGREYIKFRGPISGNDGADQVAPASPTRR